jgi:hypothetical protein
MMLYWLSLTWYEWIQPLLLVEGMECGKVGFNVAGFQKTEDRRRVVRYASLRQWANLSCASITLAPSLCRSGDVCNIWSSTGTKLDLPLHIKKGIFRISSPRPTRSAHIALSQII